MRIIRNARTSTARIDPPAIRRPFGVMFWTRVRSGAMGQIDLGVEDVLVGLDGLVAYLRGELHRELRALDLHHVLGGVAGRAGGERLGRAGGLGLRVLEA